jgi:endonuclease III
MHVVIHKKLPMPPKEENLILVTFASSLKLLIRSILSFQLKDKQASKQISQLVEQMLLTLFLSNVTSRELMG